MTERRQLGLIQEQCERLGVLWHHCQDSRHCLGSPGLPDLILAGPGGLILPELKGTGDRRRGQVQWAYTLEAAGVRAPLWRDSHFRAGVVEESILAISGVAACG